MKRRSTRPLALLVVAITLTGGALTASSMGASADVEVALQATRYTVSVDGYEIASFNDLSAITVEVTPNANRSVSVDGLVIGKLTATVKPPIVTLKRGMSGGTELWTWYEAVQKGDLRNARKTAVLTVRNATNGTVAQYSLVNAWPVRLNVSGVNAATADTLYETLTLTADTIQRLK